MQLIKSTATVIKEDNPLVLIERIGRVCYKSDSNFTPETAFKFVKGLINRGHLSVLEHAVFVYRESCNSENILSRRIATPITLPFVNRTLFEETTGYDVLNMYSTNLRVLFENRHNDNYYDLIYPVVKSYPEIAELFEVELTDYNPLNKLSLISKDTLKDYKPYLRDNHLYTSILFTTDRGVSHEMVRHRIASFAQESTRYCNYSKDKFGNTLQFIMPPDYESWSTKQQSIYRQSLEQAEQSYLSLIESGLPAQSARGVLPVDVRTSIIMTANDKEWKHFLDLRYYGTTGSPHPNMKRVAGIARELLYKENKILY